MKLYKVYKLYIKLHIKGLLKQSRVMYRLV